MASEFREFNVAPFRGLLVGSLPKYSQVVESLSDSNNVIVDANGKIYPRPIGQAVFTVPSTDSGGLFAASEHFAFTERNDGGVEKIRCYRNGSPVPFLDHPSGTNNEDYLVDSGIPFKTKFTGFPLYSDAVSGKTFGQIIEQDDEKCFMFGYPGAFVVGRDSQGLFRAERLSSFIGPQLIVTPSWGIFEMGDVTQFLIPNLADLVKEHLLRVIRQYFFSGLKDFQEAAEIIYDQQGAKLNDRSQVTKGIQQLRGNRLGPMSHDAFVAACRAIQMNFQAVGTAIYFARYQYRDGRNGAIGLASNPVTIYARHSVFFTEVDKGEAFMFRKNAVTVLATRIRVPFPSKNGWTLQHDGNVDTRIEKAVIYRSILPESVSRAAVSSEPQFIGKIPSESVLRSNAVRVFSVPVDGVIPQLDNPSGENETLLSPANASKQLRWKSFAMFDQKWPDRDPTVGPAQSLNDIIEVPFSPNPYLNRNAGSYKYPWSRFPYVNIYDLYQARKEILYPEIDTPTTRIDETPLGGSSNDRTYRANFGSSVSLSHANYPTLQAQMLKVFYDLDTFDTADAYNLTFPPGIDDWLQTSRAIIRTGNDTSYEDAWERPDRQIIINQFGYCTYDLLRRVITDPQMQGEIGLFWTHFQREKYLVTPGPVSRGDFWWVKGEISNAPTDPNNRGVAICDIAGTPIAVVNGDDVLQLANVNKEKLIKTAEWDSMSPGDLVMLQDTFNYRINRKDQVVVEGADMNSYTSPLGDFIDISPPYVGFSSAVIFEDRLVLVPWDFTNRQIVWSLPGDFVSFPIGNRIVWPHGEKIQAVKAIGNVLLVFGKKATYLVSSLRPGSETATRFSSATVATPSCVFAVDDEVYTYGNGQVYQISTGGVRRLELEVAIPTTEGVFLPLKEQEKADLRMAPALALYDGRKGRFLLLLYAANFASLFDVALPGGESLTQEEKFRSALFLRLTGELALTRVLNFPLLFMGEDGVGITADRRRSVRLLGLGEPPGPPDAMFHVAPISYKFSFTTSELVGTDRSLIIPVRIYVDGEQSGNTVNVAVLSGTTGTGLLSAELNKAKYIPYIAADAVRISVTLNGNKMFEIHGIRGTARVRTGVLKEKSNV